MPIYFDCDRERIGKEALALGFLSEKLPRVQFRGEGLIQLDYRRETRLSPHGKLFSFLKPSIVEANRLLFGVARRPGHLCGVASGAWGQKQQRVFTGGLG